MSERLDNEITLEEAFQRWDQKSGTFKPKTATKDNTEALEALDKCITPKENADIIRKALKGE